VTIKSLDFLIPQHVKYFKSLPVEEKRLYVGHYIDLSDLTRFTQALLHFRQRPMRLNTIQKYVQDKRALDAVQFIPGDYTSQSSHRGEMLLEHAVRMDAENFNFESQTILKKVLGDIKSLKREGKSVTVIPQGVALGHTIVEHAGDGYENTTPEQRVGIRRNVLNFLLTHDVTRDFKKQILATHHHHGNNLHRLNTYTKVVHGNRSIANLMEDLRLTKNTASPINTFEVKYNTRNRTIPSTPTHNSNPLGLPTERGPTGRVYVNNRISTPTGRVYTNQVNSDEIMNESNGVISRTSPGNKSPVSRNGSTGSNSVQKNVRLINQSLNHATDLTRSMSNDLNSAKAIRSYRYAWSLFENISNKLTAKDRNAIINKGTTVKKGIQGKEAALGIKAKKTRINNSRPSGSNNSTQQ